MPGIDTPTPELLFHGSDRDPWRPSRRLVTWLALLLAVALVAGGVVAWQRHERRLDDLAAARVSLVVTASQGETGDGLGVQLESTGPDRLTLLTVRLAGPGFAARPLALGVDGHSAFALSVPDSPRCDRSLIEQPPRGLVVRLRTARGTELTQTVPFQADVEDQVAYLVLRRCALDPAGSVVGFAPSGLRVLAGYVEVRGIFQNSSADPVTVESLTGVPGLDVVGPVPLVLPGTVGGAAGATSATLTIGVTDCAAFARTLARPQTAQQPDELVAALRGTNVPATAHLWLTLGGPDADPLPALMAKCPGQAFPPGPAR